MDIVSQLRNKHSSFTFVKYEKNYSSDGTLKVNFFYSTQNLSDFTHTLTFKNIPETYSRQLNRFLQMLGCVEGLSYWKLTCSPCYEVSAFSMTDFEKHWFLKLLRKGMSEYFYRNDISLNISVDIVSEVKENLDISPDVSDRTGALVLVGGGKDSVVTLELAKNCVEGDVRTLLVNPITPAKNCVSISGLEDYYEVRRNIDRSLLDYNKEGFLNGHVPFSASLSLLAAVQADALDFKFILLSNEHSANEGNVRVDGIDVNHQYSKSYEYEEDFRELLKFYGSDVEYISFLRPLHEIQIAALFSQFPKYFNVFQSCNAKQILGSLSHKENAALRATDRWCGSCAKCTFVFLMLSVFLDLDTLRSIFGKDVYKDESFINNVKSLCGLSEAKPFDCVGTFEESSLAIGRLLKEEIGIQDYFQEQLPLFTVDNVRRSLDFWSKDNNLTLEMSRCLQQNLHYVASKL